MHPTPTPTYAGIDWASRSHAVCIIDADGSVIGRYEVEHTAAGLQGLTRRLAATPVSGVAIERPDGPLVDALLGAGLIVFVVASRHVKALRSRYGLAGNKDDRADAYVLADVLRTDGHRLRPLRPDAEGTVALRALVRARKDLVRTRVRLVQQLNAHLELVFPGALALFAELDSWRWIFLLNVPLGLLALGVGWSAFPTQATRRAGSMRLVDLGLLGLFTFFVLFAVDALDLRSLPAALGAVICAVVVMRRNRGQADAVIAPRHAIDAPLGPLAWGIGLLLMAGIGVQTFVPLFVRGGRGGGMAVTAWSVLFFVVGWTAAANVVSRLHGRVHPLTVMLVGATLLGGSLFGIAAGALGSWPLAVVFALMFFAGGGIGGSTNAALTLIRELVEDGELGRATAAHQFVRNLGFAMGNALVGSVLLAVVGALTGDLERMRKVLDDVEAGVDPEVASAIQVGFAAAAAASGLVAWLAILPFWRVRRFVLG